MRDFDKIYSAKAWGEEGNGSGTGSMIHTTVSVRNLFCDLIENHNVRTIVDVSVGGMLWWPDVLDKYSDVQFIGYDISRIKTRENSQRFSNRPNWKFCYADVTTKKDYPKPDLIVCRHTLNHLSTQDIIVAIENIKSSGSRFIGFTQHNVHELDSEEQILPDSPGCINYRPIDLLLPPISLSAPWLEIDDADGEDVQQNWQRKFCLWKTQ